MEVLLNIYGKITKDLTVLYDLNQVEYNAAQVMLDQLQSNHKLIDSEDGKIILFFEKNKFWCEVQNYSKDKAEQISNAINGAVVFKFGEYVNSISYYGNRVMLYIVGSNYFEVFYNQTENEIIKIRKLESNHVRLSLYVHNVNFSNLNT